ncbi:MAG: hypothetical protein ACP5NS_01640 [Candidatus Pacearchaeota archaeon]
MSYLLLVLLLSIPTGLLVAWLARDELLDGRKYFKFLIALSIFLIFFFITYEYIVVSLGFIVISTWISLIKSYDPKWAIVRKM